jgi:hypothetical protein
MPEAPTTTSRSTTSTSTSTYVAPASASAQEQTGPGLILLSDETASTQRRKCKLGHTPDSVRCWLSSACRSAQDPLGACLLPWTSPAWRGGSSGEMGVSRGRDEGIRVGTEVGVGAEVAATRARNAHAKHATGHKQVPTSGVLCSNRQRKSSNKKPHLPS